MEPFWNPNSNTLVTDRLQPERSATYVIAHQYSSSTFSRNFNFHTESFETPFKNISFFFLIYQFLTFKIA